MLTATLTLLADAEGGLGRSRSDSSSLLSSPSLWVLVTRGGLGTDSSILVLWPMFVCLSALATRKCFYFRLSLSFYLS